MADDPDVVLLRLGVMRQKCKTSCRKLFPATYEFPILGSGSH
jgi:hypothetical protein